MTRTRGGGRRGPQPRRRRTQLLQCMGFPALGGDVREDPKQLVVADWNAVILRLRSHPHEAKIDPDVDYVEENPPVMGDKEVRSGRLPIFMALQNVVTPGTLPAVQAFIDAFPGALTPYNIRQGYPEDVNSVPHDVSDLVLQEHPLMVRSVLCQLLGLPAKGPHRGRHHYGDTNNNIDWDAVKKRALSNPEEASRTTQFCPEYDTPFLPLFVAIEIVREAGDEVADASNALSTIEAIMDAFPAALDSPHMFKCTELGVQPDVLEAMVQRKPTLLRSQLLQLLGCNRSPWKYYVRRITPVNWKDLEARLESHPEEAIMLDAKTSESPLDVLLLKELDVVIPHDLVVKFLDAGPQVVQRPCSAALFNACWNRWVGDETVRAVLDRNPSQAEYVLSPSEYRELSLYGAVYNDRSVSLVKQIIEAHPDALDTPTCRDGMVVATAKSVPILELLIDEGRRYNTSWASDVFLRGWDYYEHGAENVLDSYINGAAFDTTNPINWGMLCVGLRHAGSCRYAIANRSSYPLLHATIEFGKKLAFVEKAYHENPGHATQKFMLGRTPLLIAICMLSLPEEEQSSSYCGEVCESDFYQDGNAEKLISLLADAAHIPDTNGRLPLHLAVEWGLSFHGGVAELIDAYGAAVTIPDAETALLPFMMAASCNSSSLDDVYGLLLAAPGALETIRGVAAKSPGRCSPRKRKCQPA